MATDRNVNTPKQRMTETSTNRSSTNLNVFKQDDRQTKISTYLNDDNAKCRHTENVEKTAKYTPFISREHWCVFKSNITVSRTFNRIKLCPFTPLWPLLLTWFNFKTSITCIKKHWMKLFILSQNFNGCTIEVSRGNSCWSNMEKTNCYDSIFSYTRWRRIFIMKI